MAEGLPGMCGTLGSLPSTKPRARPLLLDSGPQPGDSLHQHWCCSVLASYHGSLQISHTFHYQPLVPCLPSTQKGGVNGVLVVWLSGVTTLLRWPPSLSIHLWPFFLLPRTTPVQQLKPCMKVPCAHWRSLYKWGRDP